MLLRGRHSHAAQASHLLTIVLTNKHSLLPLRISQISKIHLQHPRSANQSNSFSSLSRMSSTDEAVKTAQARAKDAATGDTDTEHHAQGDLTHTTQQVSSEHAAKHGDASGMTSAADRHHENSDDSKAHKDDQVTGTGSSSS